MRKIILGIAVVAILTGLSLSQAINLGHNSMNTKAGSGNVQYELGKPLPQINDTVKIFKTKNPIVNVEYVKEIGNIFGFTDSIIGDANPGTIGIVNEEKHLLVYNKSGAIWYAIPSKMHPVVDTQPDLPDEETAKKLATSFLVAKGFLPSDAKLSDVVVDKQITAEKGTGKILQSYNVTLQVRYQREINGMPVVGPGSKLKVFIGNNNEVMGLFKVWRDIMPPSTEIKIKTPEQAYSDLVAGNDMVPTRIGEDKVIIKDVALGYWMEPADQEQTNVLPVYIFKGDIIDSNLGYLGQYTGYVYATEGGRLP